MSANQILEEHGLTRTRVYRWWYDQQRHAKDRGISFHIDLDNWIVWWGDDITKRGRRKGELHMCRIDDKGPYTLDNIYKDTSESNSSDKVKHRSCGTKPATLTEQDVRDIQGMLRQGFTQRKIAELFSTSQRTVNRINCDKYRPYSRHERS